MCKEFGYDKLKNNILSVSLYICDYILYSYEKINMIWREINYSEINDLWFSFYKKCIIYEGINTNNIIKKTTIFKDKKIGEWLYMQFMDYKTNKICKAHKYFLKKLKSWDNMISGNLIKLNLGEEYDSLIDNILNNKKK